MRPSWPSPYHRGILLGYHREIFENYLWPGFASGPSMTGRLPPLPRRGSARRGKLTALLATGEPAQEQRGLS